MEQNERTNQSVVFNDAVLEKIAGKTATEVDGVLSLQGNLIDNISERMTDGDNPKAGVSVDLDDEQKTVDVELTALLAYGKNAQEILTKVANKLITAVRTMTGYQVKNIKLVVKDMLTPAEWQQEHQSDSKKEPERDTRHLRDEH